MVFKGTNMEAGPSPVLYRGCEACQDTFRQENHEQVPKIVERGVSEPPTILAQTHHTDLTT